MISIEQHSFEKDDGEDLWEITHLTERDLQELDDHLNLSALKVSSRLIDFHKDLKRLLSSLDIPRAS